MSKALHMRVWGIYGTIARNSRCKKPEMRNLGGLLQQRFIFLLHFFVDLTTSPCCHTRPTTDDQPHDLPAQLESHEQQHEDHHPTGHKRILAEVDLRLRLGLFRATGFNCIGVFTTGCTLLRLIKRMCRVIIRRMLVTMVDRRVELMV